MPCYFVNDHHLISAGNYGDDFPPPPPTGEYPGSGVNKGGPGSYGGPKPYGMQDRSGSRFPNDQSGPRGTYEQSPAYGQGPYDQKQGMCFLFLCPYIHIINVVTFVYPGKCVSDNLQKFHTSIPHN